MMKSSSEIEMDPSSEIKEDTAKKAAKKGDSGTSELDAVKLQVTGERPPPPPKDETPADAAMAVEPKTHNVKAAVKDTILRVQPLKYVLLKRPLHALVVLCTMLAAVFLYLLLYSAVFVDSESSLFITDVSWSTVTGCLAAAFFLFSCLLLLDASDWHRRPCFGPTIGRALQGVGLLGVSGLTLVGALLSAESYPAFPLAVFIFCFPLLTILLKRALLDHPARVHRAASDGGGADGGGNGGGGPREPDVEEQAFALISFSYKLIGVGALVTWLVWLERNDFWAFNGHTRARLKSATQCNQTHDDVTDGVLTCNAAFLLWVSPLVLSVASLVFALFFSTLAVRSRYDAHTSNSLIRGIGVMVLILFFGIWCAASIAGAGMKLAHSVMSICGAGVVALTLALLLSLPASRGHAQISALTGQVAHIVHNSEWSRALIVYWCTPLFVFYLAFALLNQSLRKLGAACSRGRDRCICQPIVEPAARIDEGVGIAPLASDTPTADLPSWFASAFSPQAAGVLRAIYQSEHKTQVLLKTLLVALVLWALSFGSTLTFIGLAALIPPLKKVSLGVVIVLFLLIGTSMFLIPVVPGLAVYLFGGLLMVDVARAQLGDPKGGGFYLACLLTVGLCYFMKLLAHVLQQKIFGETFGGRVSIRSNVQINSQGMRAIKFILMRPGLSLGKVCVLCGGPDWPTSVICGILRKSDPSSIVTLELLVGLLPMIVLIAPTVMAMALRLRTADDGPWDSIASVALATTAIVQFLAFFGASYFTWDVMAHKADELDRFTLDAEVAAFDEAQEHKLARARELTSFGRLPRRWRTLLLGSTILVTLSSYLVIFAPKVLFEEFQLATDRIEDLCFSGCEREFVKKPLGYFSLGALFLGTVGWQVFECWSGAEVRRRSGGARGEAASTASTAEEMPVVNHA